MRDENNEVKPDRVFIQEDIDTFCSVCHECTKSTSAEQTASPHPRGNACTECHDAHSLRANQHGQ